MARTGKVKDGFYVDRCPVCGKTHGCEYVGSDDAAAGENPKLKFQVGDVVGMPSGQAGVVVAVARSKQFPNRKPTSLRAKIVDEDDRLIGWEYLDRLQRLADPGRKT